MFLSDVGKNCAAVTTKNAIPWDVDQLVLLITANIVPSSPILSILLVDAIRSSKMSVLTRATRRHIAEDGNPLIEILLCMC
jgi:hypothetical protein